MKIVIITGPFAALPPYTTGAVEKIWYALGKEFQQLGHEVHFVAKDPQQGTSTPSDTLLLRGYARTGSFVKDLFCDFSYSLRALLKMPKADVVVLNSIFLPFLARLFRYKFKRSVYNVARFPKKQFKYYGNIDRLACVSTIVEQELVTQTPSARRQVKTISNPIDTELFRPSGQAVQPRSICYAGRIHPEKGIDLLVRAYAALKADYPDLTLHLIGPTAIGEGGGGEDYVAQLNAIASDLHWVGSFQDAAQLKAEIDRYAIFCYPSVAERGETFGVAPLEAMALGKPTVVSQLACFEDFLRDGENGYVFDHRSEAPDRALCEVLRRVLHEAAATPTADAFSALALRAAASAQAFSVKSIAAQYLADFTTLLHG